MVVKLLDCFATPVPDPVHLLTHMLAILPLNLFDVYFCPLVVLIKCSPIILSCLLCFGCTILFSASHIINSVKCVSEVLSGVTVKEWSNIIADNM